MIDAPYPMGWIYLNIHVSSYVSSDWGQFIQDNSRIVNLLVFLVLYYDKMLK